MDVRKLDQQQLKMADAATKWWNDLKPEQRSGYLANIERYLEQSYPKRAVPEHG